MDKVSDTPRCDHCGSHRLTGPCLRCGAPVCCEMCCKIDSLERELAAQKEQYRVLTDEMLVLGDERNAAVAQRDKAVTDADHFFVLSGKYLQRANDAEAQRDKVRDDALEQAAMVCDEYAKSGVTGAMVCAAAIRAMKECGE